MLRVFGTQDPPPPFLAYQLILSWQALFRTSCRSAHLKYAIHMSFYAVRLCYCTKGFMTLYVLQ